VSPLPGLRATLDRQPHAHAWGYILSPLSGLKMVFAGWLS
jgi:hypothetical protein